MNYQNHRESAPANRWIPFRNLGRVCEGTARCVEAVVTDREFTSAPHRRESRETGT